MENGPFEVFPIGNGDIPASYISLPKFNMLHLKNDGLKSRILLKIPPIFR